MLFYYYRCYFCMWSKILKESAWGGGVKFKVDLTKGNDLKQISYSLKSFIEIVHQQIFDPPKKKCVKEIMECSVKKSNLFDER